MSTPSETELDLDSLFLPAWAQQPANKNLYAKYEGREEARDSNRGERSRRPQGDRSRSQRGPRPQQDRRADTRPGRTFGPRVEQRPPQDKFTPQPLPEVEVQFRPDEHGIDSLARQIKMTGRAYPLFGIAQIILEKPERHSVLFTTKKNPEGGAVQPLFVCALDDSLWLSEDEAVSYVLHKHFNTFYQPERTQTEPPKGTYTFVAQCGMSGVILGPPNYHDYQNQLRKLHAERFARLPFDMFKSRVRIVRDEAVVKKWIEDQSWKTEYVCLNVPEPLRVPNREEAEKHFRQTHLAAIVKQVESHAMTGVASRSLRCVPLQRLTRLKWEDQKRFPLQLATLLSQQFAVRGLQFFKVNKTVTHVSVARPHYLDLETTPVSENVKRIVDFINAHPKCTRRQLFAALAPSALPTVQTATEESKQPELTAEAGAVISDLHWLVHQGHVIEFANGVLETAKKPIAKPPPKPAAPTAAVIHPTETDAPPSGISSSPESTATVEAPHAADGPVSEALPEVPADENAAGQNPVSPA
jgi:hypothetical protein